jgi:hypothetical protein
MEDRSTPMEDRRTLRRRRTMRGRGMRRVRGWTMRGGVMSLLQDPHPHTNLGAATSFALL